MANGKQMKLAHRIHLPTLQLYVITETHYASQMVAVTTQNPWDLYRYGKILHSSRGLHSVLPLCVNTLSRKFFMA